MSAYGIGFHRHNSEIQQELNQYTKTKINFTFTPHLSPMFRGILSTIYLDLKPNSSIQKVYKVLKKFHKNNKFVKVLDIGSLLSKKKLSFRKLETSSGFSSSRFFSFN